MGRLEITSGNELRSVVLGTTNKGKLADFRFLFEGTGVELALPSDFGVELEVEETGTTFEANALLKARAFAAELGKPVLADDSGLEVAALDGAPGVYSARFAGPECDDAKNNAELLRRMQSMRDLDDRRAAFVCVLALVLTDGREFVIDGRCEGTVAFEERGANGFGYDSLFYREDLGRTFGESTPAEKNARSHRAAAVVRLLAILREQGLVG